MCAQHPSSTIYPSYILHLNNGLFDGSISIAWGAISSKHVMMMLMFNSMVSIPVWWALKIQVASLLERPIKAGMM